MCRSDIYSKIDLETKLFILLSIYQKTFPQFYQNKNKLLSITFPKYISMNVRMIGSLREVRLSLSMVYM